MSKKYLHRQRCDNAIVDLYDYLLKNDYSWKDDKNWIAVKKCYNRYLDKESVLIPYHVFRNSCHSLCFDWTCVNKEIYIYLYSLCYQTGEYDRSKLIHWFKEKRKFEIQFYKDGKIDSKKFYHWMDWHNKGMI